MASKLPRAPRSEPAGPLTRPSVEPPRNWLADWALNILILLFGTTTVVQAFVVPTGSMESNILIGDHLLVDKLSYAPHGSLGRYLLPYREVQRGDIIVFRYPLDPGISYVKRVIGVPGDRIHLVNKRVYLNGQVLTEPYVQHVDPRHDAYRDDFPSPPNRYVFPRGLDMLSRHVVNGELVVPPDMFFAMGDNRDDSSDSRFWGLVPRENITGQPLLIFWSYDAPTSHLAEPTPGFDHLMDLARNFFTKTRWRRTFQFVRPHPLS